MIGAALVAAAAAPTKASGRPGSSGDFVGSWITWWDIDGEMSPCSRMVVAPESETTLDGMWAAPGWNGLLHGTVEQTRGGVRWRGEWRDQNGAGGFRFVLGAPGAPANRFQGTYTTQGSSQELSWTGERVLDGEIPDVPCTFEG